MPSISDSSFSSGFGSRSEIITLEPSTPISFTIPNETISLEKPGYFTFLRMFRIPSGFNCIPVSFSNSYAMPKLSFASSLIMSGFQGGSHTISTKTFFTPRDFTAPSACLAIVLPMPHPGVVSVILR